MYTNNENLNTHKCTTDEGIGQKKELLAANDTCVPDRSLANKNQQLCFTSAHSNKSANSNHTLT